MPAIPVPENVEKNPPQELLQTEAPLLADEQAAENDPESKEHFLEEEQKAEETPPQEQAPPTRPIQVAATALTIAKDEIVLEIEKILEKGLGELYVKLPDSAKPKFKEKGEKAASEISTMFRTLKFQAKRALELIRDWLLTIPHVNRFFLEQEAKIKVDLILQLFEEEKTKRQTIS